MDIAAAQQKLFTRNLLHWHCTDNTRSLPWKSEKDPYRIWLSEIILQQTRADQGQPYYLRFVDAYPTVHDLAGAEDDAVFRLWQGLGYYNRCRNLLATARYISGSCEGLFPDNYEALLSLKGIGSYTAAAIASFAFGLPHAVVDGNVIRVLARYFAIDTPRDTITGKKIFRQLADALLDKEASAAYNQAIMDLGATICKPAAPACEVCPVQTGCAAAKQGLTALLPVKSRKIQIRKRHFHYVLIFYGGMIWVAQRKDKDIWQQLYQPFLIEHSAFLGAGEIGQRLPFPVTAIPEEAGTSSQQLTHQLISTRFFLLYPTTKPEKGLENGIWITIADIKNLAFPKTIVSFLEKNNYFEVSRRI